MNPTKYYLTAEQIAERLQCGKSTVYALAKAGRIPSLGLGKKGRRFDFERVIEALECKVSE
jgi:excisionase family DNA binding protein